MGRAKEKKRSQKISEEEEREERRGDSLCFPMICGSGGSKTRLAKAAGAEPAGQMRDEKLLAVLGANQMCKTNQVQSTFGC